MTLHDKFHAKASGEIGTKEIAGPEANPRIQRYHSATSLNATSDEVPWCSAFACWVVSQCGKKSPGSAWAKSWLHWGVPLKEPVKGCICVFTRGEGGHVGFYDHEDGENIFVLGGNQKNEVNVSPYPKSRLIEFRGVTETLNGEMR